MIKFTRVFFSIALLTAATFLSCKKNPVEESEIVFSKKDFSVSASEQTTSFTISSPADWSIETTDTWLSVSPESGSKGTTTVTIDVDKNTVIKIRTGSLNVSAPDISKKYVLLVTQSAYIDDGGGDGDDDGDLENASDEIKWIYNTLSSKYYWNDAVKTAKPKYNLAYNDFLEDLLLNLTGAEDPDGTIDGGYSDGERYIYSYIDRTATRANGTEQTFGFDFQYYWKDASQTELWLLIKWVQPGSPADLAGLKRGMWITKYQDAPITESRYYTFAYQLYYMQGGTQMKLTLSDNTSVTLNAVTMEVTPVIYNSVITSGTGKKVGYLVYNEFERGSSAGGNRYKFDNQLRDVFAGFNSAGVTELVLDLRYNPGGYVNSCQILTSLIGSGTTSSSVFAKLKYNSSYTTGNPQIWYYLNESSRLTNLTRVFVLAKGSSASASEMVINSLRGVKGNNFVIHIGQTTEGKNVGMDQYTTTINGYYYEMWPITFKIYNSQDFADYANGFTPNYKIDEFRNRGSKVYEFGNPNEELLKAALTLIDGGTPTVDTRSTGDGYQKTLKPVQQFRGGARVIPSETQGME